MTRTVMIGGQPVAVRVDRLEPWADEALLGRYPSGRPRKHPSRWHVWSPGYGSATGDTIEEACDSLADQWAALLRPAAAVAS